MPQKCIDSYDRQILSSQLASAAEWHGYAALRDAAKVPAMFQDALNIPGAFRSSAGPSKRAVWTTCGIVACACLSYIAWSLSDRAESIADAPAEGITLSARDASEVQLQTPNLAPAGDGDETPLELDNSIETDGLPVINAHLEVPTSAEPLQLRDLPEAQLRQLSHERGTSAGSPDGSAGAWLTGTIDFAGGDADPALSRYLR